MKPVGDFLGRIGAVRIDVWVDGVASIACGTQMPVGVRRGARIGSMDAGSQPYYSDHKRHKSWRQDAGSEETMIERESS